MRRILASQRPAPRVRPHLRVVRHDPLELPCGERLRRRDSAAAGWAIAVSLLLGAVLIAVAMGWWTP